MLNLLIAMLKRLLISLAVFLVQSANISIVSPQPGDVLRGQVEIAGNMNVPNFASAELAFSHASDPADSWFTIQTFSQPVTDPILSVWDTATITDGDYILHLRVMLQDGTVQDAVVSDLKIRNDEPLPTPSPAPTFPSQFSTPLPASTAQPVTVFPTFPSPTSLPSNPVSVTPPVIYSNFARGALATLVLFVFFFLILRLRKN
jgi:hypothetical protein